MAIEALLFQAGLGNVVNSLEGLGFFRFLFPFLLSLAILYSIIQYAAGDRIPKSANGLISIIISFFVMLYASWNPGITTFFANISGEFLIVGSGILFLIVILGVAGFKLNEFGGEHFKWAIVLFLILVGFLIFFGAGGAKFLNVPSFAQTQDFWTVIFFVVILAIVFVFLTKGDAGGGKPAKKEG